MDNVGIVALLLAIPLSIAANLFTPFIKDWLVLFSQRWSRRRLAQLERELAYSEIEVLLRALRDGLMALIFFTFGLIFHVAAHMEPQYERGYDFLSALILVLSGYVAATGGKKITTKLTPKSHEYMQKTIAKLKLKLSAR